MPEIVLVFDGGSLGNPGKGYGSYRLTTNGNHQPIRELDFGDNITNNWAEYQTMIEGLQDAVRLLEKYGYDPAGARISVLTDSKLVVEQVSGRWKVKSAELRPLVLESRLLLGRFGTWTLEWHPRANSVKVLGH